MRNQKGEATLFCVLILVALSSLLTLCSLELQRTFGLTQKRTHLFLCAKESKGELNHFLKNMGLLNWALKNISKTQMIAVLFPPLIAYVGNAQKLKKAIQLLQLASLAPYQVKMLSLKKRGCPLDPRVYLTPYQLGTNFGFVRNGNGSAKLRMNQWTYYYLERPYLLTLKVNAAGADSLSPNIHYQAEEKLGILSSHFSSR